MISHRQAAVWQSVVLVVATCLACCQAFEWQSSHSVAVLGNHLYIHGGKTTRQVAGRDEGWSPDNTTWAIPIDTSWSLGSGNFRKYAIENRDFLPTARPALWTDPTGTRMYTWGGSSFNGEPSKNSDEPRLNTFILESNTSRDGRWERSRARPEASSGQKLIHRTHLGSWASCNGLGFYMGGMLAMVTDSSTELWGNKRRALPGLILFNMTDGTWANETADAFGQGPTRGTHMDGSAVCLPTLGTNRRGIIVFISGRQGTINDETGGQELPMDRIIFYDIGSKTFHTQRTTGNSTPSVRTRGCVVATTGTASSGSYEIFMYGGEGVKPADLWVLTVPGFRWFPAPPSGLPPTQRFDLSCAVAGKGQRQMIAVGGTDGRESKDDNAWKYEDAWARNMQVLDLKSLKWSGDYDADAAAYEPPAMVEDWLRNGGLSSVKWDSSDTRALFADVLDAPRDGGQPGDKPRSDEPAAAADPPTSAGTNVAAIAGGVAGGVGALLVVAAACFYFCWYQPRRRRVGQSAAEGSGGGQWHQEDVGTQQMYKPRHDGVKELNGSQTAQTEMDGGWTPPAHELGVHARSHELA